MRWTGNVLIVLSVGAALLLAEWVLRAIGIGGTVFHRPDSTYGMALIPGANGVFAAEGRAQVSINSDGMRDAAHARAKPRGTFRIALLGDSYAEALQVPRDSTFWAVLGANLVDCDALAHRPIEVLNFGVSGYSTTQEYLLLRQRVWEFDPDAVLVAFVTGNDVADNSPSLSASPRPYFRFHGDSLVLDSSRARAAGIGAVTLHWLVRHSRLLQVGNQLRLNLAMCGKAAACGEDLDAAKGERGLRNAVYHEPRDEGWRDAWRVTEALITKIRDEAAAHHVSIFLVTLSNGIQVHPDLGVREQFRTAMGGPDLFYADNRIAALAQREGIASLALAPVLAAQAEQRHIYFHGWPGPNLGKGHWNVDGHRAAGTTIAPFMCQALRDR